MPVAVSVSEERRSATNPVGTAVESRLFVGQLVHDIEASQVLANQELSQAVEKATVLRV